MADAYVAVQPDSSGKKVQTFENTVGGQTVEAQAVVPVNPTTGAAISPAQDRTTAGAPNSVELSDGAAFYTAAKTGQLPSALVSGRLDVNVGADGVGLAKEAGGHLASLDSKTPASPATDRTTAGAPFAVELSDGAAFYTGAKTGQLPSALVSGRLDVNLGADAVGLAKESGGHLASVDTKTPALGAAATASSTPVNIANDQTVPISAAALPLPAGAATAARQDTGNTSLASVDGKLPAQVGGRVPVDGSGVTQPISAQVAVQSPSLTNGAQTPLQIDLGGNLRMTNAEDVRQRATFEESRFITEQGEFLAMRGRSAEVRTSFIDRRGSVGQRGTIR